MMSTTQTARPHASALPLAAALAAALVTALVVCLAGPAAALELKSFKDDLFAYPAVLLQADNGAIKTVDYQKKRDIHQRDKVPELHVKGKYVDLKPRRMQLMTTLTTGGRTIDFVQVGEPKKARFAVIFIHGRGGDRRLGANDYKFGGNFNRIKNLAVNNGGLYLAPSIRSFDEEGYKDLKALLGAVHAASPEARIVLACASMGSILCWQATRDAETVKRLAGMMILGGLTDRGFTSTPAHARKLPMFLSHGSDDTVYKAIDQLALATSLVDSGYPARFVLFQTGSHGTPVRMTDWRDTLNWIFRQ